MQMTDLLSPEEWKELEQELHRYTGLDTNVYDRDGFTFTGLKQWANRVCPEIKSHPDALQSVCSVAHQNLAQIAENTREPVVEECDIGLMKIVVPVIADGEFLGAVGACGHLLEGSELETFLMHKLTGLDESRIQELAEDLPQISESQAMTLAREMEQRVQSILSDLASQSNHPDQT